MDKLLKPDKFDTEPDDLNANKQWTYWYKTFSNFILALGEQATDKLALLICHIAPCVFEYISECNSFDRVIATLENLYNKPKSSIFARHLLHTRKQESGESLDQFLQPSKQFSLDG